VKLPHIRLTRGLFVVFGMIGSCILHTRVNIHYQYSNVWKLQHVTKRQVHTSYHVTVKKSVFQELWISVTV